MEAHSLPYTQQKRLPSSTARILDELSSDLREEKISARVVRYDNIDNSVMVEGHYADYLLAKKLLETRYSVIVHHQVPQ